MLQVNMFEAKTDLSKLMKMLEEKTEDIIYLARNGKPIAQITLIPKNDVSKRIGAAKGKIVLPDDFDERFDNENEEIFEMFESGDLF